LVPQLENLEAFRLYDYPKASSIGTADEWNSTSACKRSVEHEPVL